MGSITLADILITPLKKIYVPNGDVFHAMKSSDIGFKEFGEAYFSFISKGAIKAWKRHKLMSMNLIVPVGSVKFVFCQKSESYGEIFRIEKIGIHSYHRITVPPGIWFGFQGLGGNQNLVLNIASIENDPNDVERLKQNEINYDWAINL